MKLRPKKSARENASRLLPRLAEEFFAAGDESIQEKRPQEVHPFRILTKRFRYALEYFRPCYGSALDSYLEMLRELQRELGDLNDSHSSRLVFRDLLRTENRSARNKKLFAALDLCEQELTQKFRAHWQKTFESPTMRTRFMRYLSHPPKGKK